MDIRVSGHQIDTGSALQEHVDDRLNSIVDKYFNRAISSHVTFGKGPGGAFTSDIVTHVMQGLILKGHAEAARGEGVVPAPETREGARARRSVGQRREVETGAAPIPSPKGLFAKGGRRDARSNRKRFLGSQPQPRRRRRGRGKKGGEEKKC